MNQYPFGSDSIQIMPEQMQAWNAVLILVLIPIMDRGVYPLLRRFGFPFRPLQRMVVGMLFTVLSFIVAGFLQVRIAKDMIPSDKGELVCGPNPTVNLFWQIPQYLIMTIGEVLFSITGLEFAYSQAPASMKAVCQAAWLFTVVIGNLIVLVVAAGSFFSDRATEFFFFAGLMFSATLIFAVMSRTYRYVHNTDDDDTDEEVVTVHE